MAWRRAKSLVVLGDEVHAISPQTTIYDIGDAAHQASKSDHNPNAAGVVCAIDIMQGHTDLTALAEKIRTSGHPDLAYLIWNRRIANRKTGFQWTAYGGSNPHTDHIHVSVGVGTDGQRTPPYDDLRPWGIAQEADMTPDEHARLYATDERIREALITGSDSYDDDGMGPTQPWIVKAVKQLLADVAALKAGGIDPAALAAALAQALKDPAVKAVLIDAGFQGAQRAERE